MKHQMQSFDTYTHVNELKKAGFNEKQASVIIKSLVESRENNISNLATKDQITSIEKVMATKDQIISLENRITSIEKVMATKEDIRVIETKISEMHASTLKWMIGTMIAFSGIIVAGIKLL